MTLLAPAAMWFSLVGLAVLGLYLLKIRRRRQVVPALDFWRSLAPQTQARSLFQQLRRWLSLLLWLAIVACLVFAVGNPVFSWGAIKPQSIAVIIDNSASMQTTEPDADGRSRLRLAVESLGELLDGRPVRDEWLLIEAARQPRVRQGWSRDRKSLRAAAEGMGPHLGSADVEAAFDLARQLMEGKPRPQVVIITDGAAGKAASWCGNDPSVTCRIVGATRDNLGVTRLRARAHRQRLVHHIFVQLVNASAEERETQLLFDLDGVTAAVEPVTVAGGGTWEKTVTLSAPQGGVLRVSIDRPDDLPLDNDAFAILEPIEAARILLVSAPDDAFFFEQALQTMEPLVDVESSRTVTPAEYDQLGSPGAPFDLVVFNGVAPASLPANGRFLFVDGWPADVAERSLGTLDAPELILSPVDHALTRYLSVSGATLARAKRVDLLEGLTVLARSRDGAPLIFLAEQPGRRSVCLAFDVMESDLPFRNAFPVFLRNVVLYLAAQRQSWIHDQYRIGDVIEPLRPLPEGIREVRVARPNERGERQTAVPVESGRFTFDATVGPGPLRFGIGDEADYTAVNLTDVDESRIAPVAGDADPATELAVSGRVVGAMPWLALAALATLLVAGEWLTYHHRYTE